MQVSKKTFGTATEAAEYGHKTRRKSRLLRRLFEKDEDEGTDERDS